VEKRTLRELLDDLYARVGEIYTKRINIRLSPELEAVLPDKLQNPPQQIGGKQITEIIKIDGNKFLFDDGSWMLFRKSGTEPVVRLYGEAGNSERLAEVMKQGEAFILA